jgi:Domain of unknown function (DUF4365)
MNRKRLSQQKRQELRSKSQISLALEDAGWVVNRPQEDLGEDLFVSLYDTGASTGLSFLLQAKSTQDLSALALTVKPGALTYPIEVKDLEHWNDHTPPVVIVVWDVEKKVGVWRDVPSVIRHLDRTKTAWRSQKSVAVELLFENDFQVRGLAALRHRLADLALPSIHVGKKLIIQTKFIFQKTPEGKKRLTALRAAVDEGLEITISKENIAAVQMPDWWERLYGNADVHSLTIGKATSDANLKLVIFVRAMGAPVERIEVQLRATGAGLRWMTLESGDDAAFRVTLRTPTRQNREDFPSLTFGFQHPHRDVDVTLALTRVLLGLVAGGALDVELADGTPFATGTLSALPSKEYLMAWKAALEHAQRLVPKIRKYGKFHCPSELTYEDVHRLKRLEEICFTGTERATATVRASLRNAPFPSDPIRQFSAETDGGVENVFGVSIPLGRTFVEAEEFEALNRGVQQSRRRGTTDLEASGVKVRITYHDWGPAKSAAEE